MAVVKADSFADEPIQIRRVSIRKPQCANGVVALLVGENRVQVTQPIHISRVETIRLRADVDSPPSSTLGAMQARNGLLVRIEDTDGAFGWGEVWCNFPPHASQSRQQLLQNVIAPELVGQSFVRPEDVRSNLEARWNIMALHVGEPGPFGHCIAGLDMAVWDLWARRQGQSLSALLSRDAGDSVKVYASSPDPANAASLVAEFAEAGYDAFKLKVGYDSEHDERLVRSVRGAVGNAAAIMVDANQVWSLDEARDNINRLARYGLTFAEEPISAVAPISDWVWLADQADVPLAAGENICDEALFAKYLEAGALMYYQPDVAKWGGIGGCSSVARRVIDMGFNYCPHFMGTAVGLAASIHLLAAAGGSGFVELDANPNPLRTGLCEFDLNAKGGRVSVPAGTGIGVIPDAESLRRYRLA